MKIKSIKCTKWLVVSIAIITVLSVAFFIKNNENSTVAYVNNEPISYRELKIEMENEKASIYSYFKNNYNADDSKDFWIREFNGITPLEKVKEDALNKLKVTKAKQLLFKQNNLIESTSYQWFVDQCKKQNISRKEDEKQGKVIYGPLQYDERVFFEYVMGSAESNLKEKIVKDKIKDNESKIKMFYDENKYSLYTKNNKLKIGIFEISSDISNGTMNEKGAKEIAFEIQQKLSSKEQVDNFIKDYLLNNKRVKYEEVLIDEKQANKEAQDSKVIQEALNLKVEDVSPIIETDKILTIIKCMERSYEGFYSFEEVKDSIIFSMATEEYNKMLLSVEKSLEITKTKAFDSIEIN